MNCPGYASILGNTRKTECGATVRLLLAVRAAPFALLSNTRKTERGARVRLLLAVRAAPFALLSNTRKTERGATVPLLLAVRAAPFALRGKMNDPVPESGLDRLFALSRVGGDEELLKEIAALFLEDYPNSLREIRAAMASGDASQLERTAHSLKGSVANFGARDAVAFALRLEQMGRARQLRESAEALQALEQALAALRSELEAL